MRHDGRMPSLFPPLIGIQCSDGVLRAVLFSARWWSENETVDKVCELEVPSDLLTPDGVIKNAEECGRLLRAELAKHGVSAGASAAVLLPSERVYNHIVSLPVGPARKLQGALQAELERFVPEDVSSLQIRHRVLSQTKQLQEIGVAAARRDVIDRYTDMVKAADLRLDRMTTFTSALACCAKGKDFLLLVAPTASIGGTLTLIHEHWPIAEALLPPGMPETDIIQEVKDMLTDYASRSVIPKGLVYVGDPDLEAKLGQLTIPVEHFEPRLEQDRVWSALLVACIAPANRLAANFADRKGIKAWHVFAVLVGVIAVAGLYLFFFS